MGDSDLLKQVFDLVSKFTLVGGGLLAYLGTIILAGALKDKMALNCSKEFGKLLVVG